MDLEEDLYPNDVGTLSIPLYDSRTSSSQHSREASIISEASGPVSGKVML